MTSHPTSEYKIGIICALPKELKAVRAILDEEHKRLTEQDPQDHNNYVLGRVGAHYVVVAGLPTGVYGTTSAASVGKDMLRTFRELRFGLLVGIGGGIPNIQAGRDVRLGDVVVSQPVDIYGGVVQYDLGKELSTGQFERKGTINKPPQTLLTALTSLQGSLKESQVPRYIEEIYHEHPSLKALNYCYPGSDRDQLHCATCDPSKWWWLLWVCVVWLWPLWRCHECDDGWVRRHRRAHSTPMVHYGTIASGNKVVKDSRVRDRLGSAYGAICLDMEAAGLDDYPCLVIRGVCDYADAYKNDVWQEYAALTAAVFTKELLEYVSSEMTKVEKPILDAFAKLDHHFQRQEEHFQRQQAVYARQEVRYQDKRHRECHRVFKIGDYEGQKNINPDAVLGTCRWVLDHPQYQSWLASTKDDLLWISADPGCGKSVLSKLLVDIHLRQTASESTNLTVGYYFFKDNEQQNSLSAALCAILHQLFSDQPSLISHAFPAFDKSGDKLPRDTHELWRILHSAANDVTARPVFCVFDALDECNDKDRAQLIEFFCQTYKSSSTSTGNNYLKLLATSRPYDDVRDQFAQIPSDLPSIRLRGEDESDQIRDEINLVIRQRMQVLSRELDLSMSKTEEVTQQLFRMEHRTYLWLYLAIDAIKDSFREALRPSDQEIVLVPASVEEAYERILSRVNSIQREKAKAVLTIIVGARRPLSVQEMALALDVSTCSQTPSALADLTINTTQLEVKIRRWCGLFVIISGNRLYLLHQTAKEFLLKPENKLVLEDESWKHCLRLDDVEKQLATICIEYLNLSDFNNFRYKKDNAGQDFERPGVQSFFDFAAEHWAEYVQSVEEQLDQETWVRMKSLYDASTPRWTRWTSVMWTKTGIYFYYDFSMNNIQLAAFNGHGRLIRELLDNPTLDIDSRDGEGKTSLMRASERGFYAVVKLLLDKGANVNAPEGSSNNPLYSASRRGHIEIVKLLLDKGADVNAPESSSDSALQAALVGGHTEIAKLLLGKWADVNAQGGVYGNAVQAASYRGHIKTVKLLLENGADVNAQGGDEYGNALQAALGEGHTEVAKLLLNNGADVNAQGGRYGNALHAALGGGYTEIVKLLLDKGADVNAKGRRYGNILQAASYEGHIEIVKLLLDKDADVNVQGGLYGNALHAALGGSHTEIVKLLLENGADINAQGQGYGNALHAASYEGRIEIVKLLLDNGADVNAQGGLYGDALRAASKRGHGKVVKLLRDRGAGMRQSTT